MKNEERRVVAFSILHSKFFIRNSSVKKKGPLLPAGLEAEN